MLPEFLHLRSMNSYSDIQLQKDAEYRRAWASLSAAEKRRLAKAGVHGPELPSYRTGKPDQDSLLSRAEEQAPQPNQEHDQAEILRRLIGELVAASSARLTIECLALVTGICFDGDSLTDIAKRHKVTRAAVSKRCVDLANALGLPPSHGMRSLTVRRRYERRARDSHARDSY